MGEDASVIKEKIVSVLNRDGPSLPIKIAKEVESNTLFTSAFLSELLAEQRIMMSNLRIGNSALFFISGQEFMLEKFSDALKSKEKEAFSLLREKRFLRDSEQNPAIRVALREIKDFAMSFQKNTELIWRFFTVPEFEFSIKEKPIAMEKAIEKVVIAEQPIEAGQIPTIRIKTKKKRSKSKKTAKNKEFLNKVKEFLAKKSIEIIEMVYHGKNEIVLKIKDDSEKILVAFDKKKISEKEILRAAKKASEFKLPFKIFSYGDLPKKTRDLIEFAKNLSSIEKLE